MQDRTAPGAKFLRSGSGAVGTGFEPNCGSPARSQRGFRIHRVGEWSARNLYSNHRWILVAIGAGPRRRATGFPRCSCVRREPGAPDLCRNPVAHLPHSGWRPSLDAGFRGPSPGRLLRCHFLLGRSPGIVLGDPLDGKFSVLMTSDGGESWGQVSADGIPAALPGEGAFAASGTCLAVQGTSEAWFGTGGHAARVLHSRDGGRTWSASMAPLVSGKPSAGIFSVAFRDARNGVAVGGDYKNPEAREHTFATTADGGATWELGGFPSGYRSAIAYVGTAAGSALIAVGTTGSDFSLDGGATWVRFDSSPYHSSASAEGVVWSVGPAGRIGRLSGAALGLGRIR